MANVRAACESDIEAIVGMAVSMLAESPRLRNFSISVPKIRATAQAALSLPNGCAIVAESGGVLVGMAVVFLIDYFLGFDKIVTDAGIYVTPEHRGSTIFVRMMKQVETWAQDQGADELMLGISTEVEPERTVHVYERMGFRVAAFSMLKDLRDV